MAIRYQLPRETAVDKILNAANVFLDKELDRKQRREETEANRQFREQQLDSLNDYRDEQTEFREKQFDQNVDFQNKQLQRSDEKELFSTISSADTLDKKTNMFKVLDSMTLSEPGQKRRDIMLANHNADMNNPIRNVAGFRDLNGIETAWESSGLAQKPNLTYQDRNNFFKNFMSERNIFTLAESAKVAGYMSGADLARKNLKVVSDQIKDARASIIMTGRKMTEEDIRTELKSFYDVQRMEQERLTNFSNKAFNALSTAGAMPGYKETEVDVEPSTSQSNLLPYIEGSNIPTFDQVKSDSTYIGSFTLPDGGQAAIDANRDITLNEPADFDPNKNFEQEEEDTSAAKDSVLLDYSGSLDYLPTSQAPPVSRVTQGDDVNAISRLASAEMAEARGLGGVTDIFGKIGDIVRQSSATQRDIGTGSGGVLSMGGATRDQIKAVRNAEVNLDRIENDLYQLKTPLNPLTSGDSSIYQSQDEYLSLNESKNKEFQSYLINISQAINQPNLTNPVKNKLTKTLDKYILKVDKAVAKAERSSGTLSVAQKPVYNKETVALANAIKTGQVLPGESVDVAEEGGLESTLRQAFENLDPNEKQIYGNDFEAYRVAYVNRIKNMITYGKMDESQGEEILQQFQ